MEKDFFITGFPRSGTGFMAGCFNRMGYDVGHEKMGKHGISDWTKACDSRSYLGDMGKRSDHQYKYLIHVVRNPFEAIGSFWFTAQDEAWEFLTENTGGNFLRAHFPGLLDMYMKWNRMVHEMKPDLTVKVESPNRVRFFLADEGYSVNEPIDFADIFYNERPYWRTPENRALLYSMFLTLPMEQKEELANFCLMHNYTP